MVEPELKTSARLGRWVVGVVVLPVCGDSQRGRQYSATTAHRALPLCKWAAVGMPWSTERLNAASVASSRCGGACTEGCGRAGQVDCGGCGFAFLWRFPEEEAAFGNFSLQNHASM